MNCTSHISNVPVEILQTFYVLLPTLRDRVNFSLVSKTFQAVAQDDVIARRMLKKIGIPLQGQECYSKCMQKIKWIYERINEKKCHYLIEKKPQPGQGFIDFFKINHSLVLLDTLRILCKATGGPWKEIKEEKKSTNTPYNRTFKFLLEDSKECEKISLPIKYCFPHRITFLPKEIEFFSNLKELNISNNALKSLPLEIGTLFNLEKLDLSCNSFEYLPLEIVDLTHLRELNLESNRFRGLRREIGILTNLERLNLANNQLESLPYEMAYLTNLLCLHLDENRLQTIPRAIGGLINLQYLDLNFNRLRTLPSAIGNLPNLETLNVSKNQLESLPRELRKLSSLTLLNVDYNPLMRLDPYLNETNVETLLNNRPESPDRRTCHLM